MPKHALKGIDLDKFVKKGWILVDIPAGETESEPFLLTPDEDAHVLGITFDENGNKFKGRWRPHPSIVEDDNAGTAKIVLRSPAVEDVTALYMIDAEDEYEDDFPVPI